MRARVRWAKRPCQATGSGQMAKNSASRLPPAGGVKIEDGQCRTGCCEVPIFVDGAVGVGVGVDDEPGGVKLGRDRKGLAGVFVIRAI